EQWDIWKPSPVADSPGMVIARAVELQDGGGRSQYLRAVLGCAVQVRLRPKRARPSYSPLHVLWHTVFQGVRTSAALTADARAALHPPATGAVPEMPCIFRRPRAVPSYSVRPSLTSPLFWSADHT